jgi:beta-N-acetylhexosaminidase
LLAVLVLGLNIATTHALTNGDLYSINNNTAFFDPTAVACGDTEAAAAGSDQTTAQQIASTFIIGFDASTPKSVIVDLATKYHIGGTYVLGTNDAAGDGFNKAFYNSLDQAAGSPLVNASDEEGVITRYAYPSGSFPTAADMAKQGDAAVTAIGKKAGAVMAAAGLNTDLAPVLDLRSVGVSGRAFSSDPDVVAEKAGAFASGLEASNINPIFKHFPGFDSSTSGNTDNTRVVMNGSITNTVKPYKDLLSKHPDAGVMLSNMYVKQLDANNPSSLSSDTVTYLRSTIGFKGMVTTDDLSVKSVTDKAGSLATAVAQSLQAGVTMPLFTLSAPNVQDAEGSLNKIVAAVQANTTAMSSIKDSQTAISKFKGLPTGTVAGSGTSCCGTSSTVLIGTDPATQVWNYFKGKGLDDNHVAAIMGNLKQESSYNPEIIQGGGTTKDPSNISVGWGIVQWTPGSKVLGIAKKLKITGPIYALATQLDIVWGEMNSTTPAGATGFMSGFKGATSLADATSYFTTNYEAAGIIGPRLQDAQDALKKFGGSGSGVPDGANGASGAGCAVSTSCTSAAGVAKILCAAKKYDPVSYQESVIGGHQGAAAWHKSCPTIGASCYLDCSGLVNVAVYDSFGVDLNENTDSERSDIGKYWKKISASEAQAGDIFQPNPGHVIIVDHIQGKTIYSFAANNPNVAQANQVGPGSSYSTTDSDMFLRYIGPGV